MNKNFFLNKKYLDKLTNLHFTGCNCHHGHNETVCEKSTGICEAACKMGLHGDSCDKGNKEKNKFKSNLFCRVRA